MNWVPLALAAMLALGAAAPLAFAQRAGGGTAEAMYNQAINQKQWKNDYTGEDFAWQTNASGLHSFLSTFERTGDQTYLDYGVKFYDALLARMATGPDGYKGFIGPYEYTPEGQTAKFWCDDHVGDALLFDGMLEFSVRVMGDPKLKEKYGDKAMSYVDAAKKNFFDKWDARGTFHQDGAVGAYITWNKYCPAGNLKEWSAHPEDPDCAQQDNLAVPFNKDLDCAAAAIRIWQVTGDEKYKHRAEMLFGYLKSRMQNYNGAMHWNYWEPAYQGDLGADSAAMGRGEWNPAVAAKTMRHWTGVHPERSGYQTGEVSNIVLAYNVGIVFTEADIKAIIQTNLKVMWNGDKAAPQWANSNADLLGIAGKPESFVGRHGSPWAALGQFEPQLRAIGGRRGGAGANAADATASFARRFAKADVEIPKVYAQFPLGNVRTVQMACVLPSIFPLGQKAAVDCKLIAPGELEVALYSADGKTQIASLKKGNMPGGPDGRAGECYFMFDGTLPDGKVAEPGDYRIRWTVTNDGYREFPITIQPRK